MKQIVGVHLYDDLSGSPLVFSTVLNILSKQNIPVEIISSKTGGFLEKTGLPYQKIAYSFNANKWMRLVLFFLYQIRIFKKILSYRNKEVVIYVNTLLPFGAALAGKLIGKPVIYHIHETSINPKLLKQFLKWVAKTCSDKILFVSEYLMKSETMDASKEEVLYNSLSNEFINKVSNKKKSNDEFSVLMLCSLKEYKGIDQFVILARSMPGLNFQLVLNATEDEMNAYFQNTQIPMNLVLFPKQENVHTFYQSADVVLNLSHPERWIETFGMTLLEAMQYRIPCIVPEVGGPAEVVEHNKNGFTINFNRLPKIISKIQELSQNSHYYKAMSRKAKRRSSAFNNDLFVQNITRVITPILTA